MRFLAATAASLVLAVAGLLTWEVVVLVCCALALGVSVVALGVALEALRRTSRLTDDQEERISALEGG